MIVSNDQQSVPSSNLDQRVARRLEQSIAGWAKEDHPKPSTNNEKDAKYCQTLKSLSTSQKPIVDVCNQSFNGSTSSLGMNAKLRGGAGREAANHSQAILHKLGKLPALGNRKYSIKVLPTEDDDEDDIVKEEDDDDSYGQVYDNDIDLLDESAYSSDEEMNSSNRRRRGRRDPEKKRRPAQHRASHKGSGGRSVCSSASRQSRRNTHAGDFNSRSKNLTLEQKKAQLERLAKERAQFDQEYVNKKSADIANNQLEQALLQLPAKGQEGIPPLPMSRRDTATGSKYGSMSASVASRKSSTSEKKARNAPGRRKSNDSCSTSSSHRSKDQRSVTSERRPRSNSKDSSASRASSNKQDPSLQQRHHPGSTRKSLRGSTKTPNHHPTQLLTSQNLNPAFRRAVLDDSDDDDDAEDHCPQTRSRPNMSRADVARMRRGTAR